MCTKPLQRKIYTDVNIKSITPVFHQHSIHLGTGTVAVARGSDKEAGGKGGGAVEGNEDHSDPEIIIIIIIIIMVIITIVFLK